MNKMDSFEFLEDYFPNSSNEAFHWSDATYEELTELINFGFNFQVHRGDVYLDTNAEALAKVIFEAIQYQGEVSDVVEYRFTDKDSALLEIETVYLTDKSKTVSEVIDDILTDWVLNDKEKEQKKKDEAEYSREMTERSYK